ncbi:MFS transporter [Streptomyces sp. RPT161]|uniref:MFS transporter n=1 Tax=Streptomyces sp. RPT161 TaxID=3015993 RepID=UPI0022B87489|nr:MFS transporter [Streptomyces sp. RPT161]
MRREGESTAIQGDGVQHSDNAEPLDGSGRAYWRKFTPIYLSGVMAAIGIGKIAPISVALRSDLRLSLGQIGLVASSVTSVAAVLGLLVSFLLRPLKPRRVLVCGLLGMAVCGVLGARSQGFPMLIAARLAESLGYVVVVIAAPVLLMGLGGSARRTTTALAVWGTFMPVGLALGSFAGGALSSWYGWRAWLTIAAGATLAVAVAGAVLLRDAGSGVAGPGPEGRTGGGLRRLLRPTALALGFATISGAIVSFVAMFPTYLHERLGLPVAQAGTLTGAVSFVGVAGGFASGWLLRRGANIATVFFAGLLMPLGAFVAFAGVGGVGTAAVGAAVIAVSNELVVAAVFAALPLVVEAASDIGTANGLVAQLGSAGSLAGPPLVGLAVGVAGGWWAVGAVLLVGCASGVGLIRYAVRGGSGEDGNHEEQQAN